MRRKIQLSKYGGFGLTQIVRSIIPRLETLGVSEVDVHKMICGTHVVLEFIVDRNNHSDIFQEMLYACFHTMYHHPKRSYPRICSNARGVEGYFLRIRMTISPNLALHTAGAAIVATRDNLMHGLLRSSKCLREHRVTNFADPTTIKK
jgi:hypothetical protein